MVLFRLGARKGFDELDHSRIERGRFFTAQVFNWPGHDVLCGCSGDDSHLPNF
jgi:hypothetical protein